MKFPFLIGKVLTYTQIGTNMATTTRFPFLIGKVLTLCPKLKVAMKNIVGFHSL